MLHEPKTLNFELFTLDPEVRKSMHPTELMFNAEEIARLRAYLMEYFDKYAFIEKVDKLLLATYHTCLDAPLQKIENGFEEYKLAYANLKKNLKYSEQQLQFITSAIIYCNAAITQAIQTESKDKSLNADLLNQLKKIT